jgi:hypothetical protein
LNGESLTLSKAQKRRRRHRKTTQKEQITVKTDNEEESTPKDETDEITPKDDSGVIITKEKHQKKKKRGSGRLKKLKNQELNENSTKEEPQEQRESLKKEV